GMPVAERVLRAGAHAEDLLRSSAVRAYHVAVAVLQPGQVLVRHIADPRAVIRPKAAKGWKRVTRQRRVFRTVRADFPDVELARSVGDFGKALVRGDGEPLTVRAELDRMLLGCGDRKSTRLNSSHDQ